jgi:squalene-hopene/tetraprenyl-beta-curcumene cyclase
LTSFVVMSLAAKGLDQHPVVKRGVDFLLRLVRSDGSWPIDTNLATWVTTLSVNATGSDLPREAGIAIRDWLLHQQHQEVHPFTGAAPGGWAWTDLSGGVPDADDTPGALLALRKLPSDGEHAYLVHQAARAGIRWLLELQNRDGGWPTFCRGWGKLPFDRSSPDLTAHALRALVAWNFEPAVVRPLGERVPRAIAAGQEYLERAQETQGTWAPLWFGDENARDEANRTYGTARVLLAYHDLARWSQPAVQRAVEWLRNAQNADGGWGGEPGSLSNVEDTAVALEALLAEPAQLGAEPVRRGLDWLCRRVEEDSLEPAPIGFYFAKLWYFERLYPIIFSVAALGRAMQLWRNVELDRQIQAAGIKVTVQRRRVARRAASTDSDPSA